jgi:hypothetical protein
MTAANRPRSKTGAGLVPVGADGCRVDRGVFPVPAQAAAATSTATTSVLCKRGARSSDRQSLSGVGMAHLPSQDSKGEHPT